MSYPEGQRVHVEFDGRIIEPLFAAEIGAGQLYSTACGFVEVADPSGIIHVLWLSDFVKDHVRLTEPDYEIGHAYMDETGRVYIRREDGPFPWLSPAGNTVSDARPSFPMRKLVPEQA